MINVDSIENGVVLDHIKPGTSLRIYHLLGLDKLDHTIAVIQNARSTKYGRKDIIKIEGEEALNLNLDMLGFLDPNITIIRIQGGRVIDKRQLSLPETLVNIVRCKNPRCITSIEEEIDHIFKLGENGEYRCVYCEERLSRSSL